MATLGSETYATFDGEVSDGAERISGTLTYPLSVMSEMFSGEWVPVLKPVGRTLAVALILLVAFSMPVSIGTPAAVFITVAYRLDRGPCRTNPTHRRTQPSIRITQACLPRRPACSPRPKAEPQALPTSFTSVR